VSSPEKSLHALVVDDSPTMRQLIVLALTRVPSLRVTEAHDGVDAWKKLAVSRFDLMLTDIHMPILDGLKLVIMARQHEAHRAMPIIVVSTEGTAQDRQRALSAGASAFLAKPLQAPQVLQAVKQLLDVP
jgi:two-component system chemotaxis response regulator CheY